MLGSIPADGQTRPRLRLLVLSAVTLLAALAVVWSLARTSVRPNPGFASARLLDTATGLEIRSAWSGGAASAAPNDAPVLVEDFDGARESWLTWRGEGGSPGAGVPT